MTLETEMININTYPQTYTTLWTEKGPGHATAALYNLTNDWFRGQQNWSDWELFCERKDWTIVGLNGFWD